MFRFAKPHPTSLFFSSLFIFTLLGGGGGVGSPPPPLPAPKLQSSMCAAHLYSAMCKIQKHRRHLCTGPLKMPKSWVRNLHMFGWNFFYIMCLCGICLHFRARNHLGSAFFMRRSALASSTGVKKKTEKKKPVYIMLSGLHCCLGLVFFRCLMCEAFQFCDKTLQTCIMCLWYSARCGARHSCRFFSCMCMRWKYPECRWPPVHFQSAGHVSCFTFLAEISAMFLWLCS